MPSFFVAAATPVVGFSQKNSGECTPTMVKPALAYLPCQSRNCGITFWQLIQPWVQNSTSTTRPRRPPMVSGGLLSHGAPAMSGAARPVRPERGRRRRRAPAPSRTRGQRGCRAYSLLVHHRVVLLHHGPVVFLHHHGIIAPAAAFVAFAMTASSWDVTARTEVFFFQAEDGIRDVAVTGVQTCALPI